MIGNFLRRRYYRQNGSVYIEWELDHLHGTDKLTTLYDPLHDGELPENIPNEENSLEKEPETPSKNTYEAHKQQEAEGGTRR